VNSVASSLSPPFYNEASSADLVSAAKAARLRYVNDHHLGIVRERSGDGFVYRDPRGDEITDEKELARIRSLAIPPAWTDVWICPISNGHLQATGRDARGRKQYRYHPRWRSVRDEAKFERMLEFAEVLPAIRRQVDKDLALPGLPREKVLAAVVRLMEHTLARVGNPEYARENNSFGLTTLKNRHVRITRNTVELDFNAKSNIRHRSTVSDRKLARILKNCRDLPGSELFQYLDETGVRHAIDSDDVNQYLRAISGCDISAKDFRTWAGTNLALMAFCTVEEDAPSKKTEVAVIKEVARQLGNTPAVCRKSYIHPAVISGYHSGAIYDDLAAKLPEDIPDVWLAERKMIRFLKAAMRPPA
jgi:DNA topoisomerase-1